MKTIQWRIAITDKNQIATLEDTKGFNMEKVEDHLTIIGLLENIKQKHLKKLSSLYEKTVKEGGNNGPDL